MTARFMPFCKPGVTYFFSYCLFLEQKAHAVIKAVSRMNQNTTKSQKKFGQ